MKIKRTPDKRRRLLARWWLLSLLSTAAVAGAVAVVSRPSAEAVPAARARVAGLTSVLSRATDGEPVPIRFEDVTAAVGVAFDHMPVPRASLLPEDMGSGVACGDYDGDGWTDLYFVNIAGNALPGAHMDAERGRCRLFRNLEGRGFEDVTDVAGVGLVDCNMGAAWGDYDNDGDPDLYVTAFGPNTLFENLGDGAFRDVTASARVQDPRFSSGCAWSDYDRDGDVDLYVCNYVDFVFREQDRSAVRRQYATEQPYTLNPSAYAPQPNSLFRNNGDGTFTESAVEAGVADPQGRSLSACWSDLNNDGWPDLYVANDVSNNAVFLNRRDGTFEDIGAASMAADYRGAMGIAAADFDDDLDLDLFITHWIAQENALYRNMLTDAEFGPSEDGRLYFMDEAERFGLGQISLDMVGWATGFADLDNDGRLDLWVVNGSTMEVPAETPGAARLEPQPVLLFWNHPRRGFVDVAAGAWSGFAQPLVGRGAACLDYDHDGRLDLVISQHGGPCLMLRNVSEPAGHYLRLRLRQEGANCLALGARVYLTVAGRTRMAEVGCSPSYLSQDEAVVHFGLGDVSHVDALRIVWPDDFEQSITKPEIDQEITLVHEGAYAAAAGVGPMAARRDPRGEDQP